VTLPPHRAVTQRLAERLDELRRRAGESPDPGLGALVEDLQALARALEVVDDDVEHQLDDLKTAALAHEATVSRYRALFEWAPDGYLVTDARACVSMSNRAMQRLLGCGEALLLGSRWRRSSPRTTTRRSSGSWPTRPRCPAPP